MATQARDPLAGDSSSFNVEKDVEKNEAEVPHDTWLCGYYDCGPPPTKGYCGLPPEERPDLSVWLPEDKRVFWLPGGLLAAALICSLVYLSDPERFYVIRNPPLVDFAVNAVAICAFTVVIWYPLGMAVWYWGVSVAISRKVAHVTLIVVIPLTAVVSSHNEGLARDMFLAIVWTSLSTVLVFSIMFCIPVRRHVHLLKIAFCSAERSEDRPNALLWMMMQSTAMTTVQTPMIQWMLAEEKGLLIFIPFLSVALGDGLAEPVGRMCGKHKYSVTALFSTKAYTRSYEGSFCVFIFTLLAVLIAIPEMNTVQIILCVLILPLANTITEAKAPHTFDNHLMWGVTWFLLWIIFDVLPTN